MPITFSNLIFYLPNSFKKHSVFLIGLGIISLIFFLFVIAIPSVTAVVDDRCNYTLGCYSGWMGAGDGCDCTSSGTVCSADTDCPAPAPVVDPECNYTLGCYSSWMGAGDGCDCTSSGTVCSADTDCPSNAPTCNTSDCNTNDGYYCTGYGGWENRNYSCSGGSCGYTTSSSGDCDDSDGWVDVSPLETQWVDDGVCKERQQKEVEYKNYSCSYSLTSACNVSVTSSGWTDTGSTRNVSSGTTCTGGTCDGSGSCIADCSSSEGDSCNRNSCGGTGIIQCDGTTCSASAPSVPSDLGDACNRNNVGEGTGVIQCDGTCSTSSAPADRALSCVGGVGGSLNAGVNYGASPEYYKIYNAWNNVTCASNIYSCPTGTTEVKVRLSYSTEPGYDFVKIYNGAGSLLESFSGNSGYTWKGPFSASSLKFGFTSDRSIPGGNFYIWQIECIVPLDDTNPSINVSGAPDSWQNTNDRANINCTDSGSGCESIENWKWLTRESYIGNCSSFNLTDYTGTYNQTKEDAGGIYIANHVWFCATARDTAGNRGYSFPVEFKIDDEKPISYITAPSYGSLQSEDFSVSVSDSDTGGSPYMFCSYGVYSDGAGWTVPYGTWRACDADLDISVGSTGDCRNEGTNKCQVQIFSKDLANNTSAISMRAFSIAFPQCSIPSVVALGRNGDDLILEWIKVPGATQYKIYCSKSEYGCDNVITSGTTLGGGQLYHRFSDLPDNLGGFQFSVQVYSSDGNICKSPGILPSFYQTGSISTRFQCDALPPSPSVYTKSGSIGSCTFTLDPYVRNSSKNNGSVLYSNDYNVWTADYVIEDIPSSADDCNDLRFENSYSFVDEDRGIIQIRSDVKNKSGADNLDVGMTFASICPYSNNFSDYNTNVPGLEGAGYNIDSIGENIRDSRNFFIPNSNEGYFITVNVNLEWCGDGEVTGSEVCDPGINSECKTDCSGFIIDDIDDIPPIDDDTPPIDDDVPPIINELHELSLWYTVTPPQLFTVFSDDVELDKGEYRIGKATSFYNPQWKLIPGSDNINSKSFFKLFTPDGPEDLIDWENVPDGTDAKIYIRAFDTAGHCTGCDDDVAFIIKKDTTPPELTIKLINSFDNEEVIGSEWLGLEGGYLSISKEKDALSGFGPNACRYSIHHLNEELNEYLTVLDSGRVCGASIDITPDMCPEGPLKCLLYTYTYDRAGNQTEYARVISFDKTLPQ